MKRLEIIVNRSIEEDMFEIFKKNNIVKSYTKIPIVHGEGNSFPKMGDSIWPEENILMIIYTEDGEAELILECIRELKQLFPNEGVKCFEIPVDCCV